MSRLAEAVYYLGPYHSRAVPEGMQRQLAELRSLIESYHPTSGYNMDETGLFYRLLPRRSLVLPTEINARGSKKDKDRITLILCANATGTSRVCLA